MFKRLFDRNKLQVAIISCGDTGQKIGQEMIRSLKKHGAKIKSLAITTGSENRKRDDFFDNIISIDTTHDGFAKKLDEGLKAAKSKLEEIDKIVEKIMPDEGEGLMLITTGAGATGLGGTLTITDLLYDKYRRVPPIVTLLPETFENSRVQYNISVFLYRIAFTPNNNGNSVLLLDNKANFSEMDQPFSDVSQRRLNTIPAAFADLLYSSFDEAVNAEFDAKVNDLYEVMHTPGVSVFVSEDLSTEDSDEVDSSRISDVILDSVMSTTSLSEDQIYDAKHAFISIFNIESGDEELSFQTEFEGRKLFRSFRETNPFIKIVKPNVKQHGRKPKLRAIISGMPLPNRILQMMRIARRSRKDIIIKELELEKEIIPLDIDRVHNLEDKLHKEI